MDNNTNFDVIYESFLSKVQDYDFALDEETMLEMVHDLLIGAISDFDKICDKDLYDNDDETFNCSLSIREIDILSEFMAVRWLLFYRNHNELLKKRLNTADFKFESNAQLLARINETYNQYELSARTKANEYSFDNFSLKDLV